MLFSKSEEEHLDNLLQRFQFDKETWPNSVDLKLFVRLNQSGAPCTCNISVYFSVDHYKIESIHMDHIPTTSTKLLSLFGIEGY